MRRGSPLLNSATSSDRVKTGVRDKSSRYSSPTFFHVAMTGAERRLFKFYGVGNRATGHGDPREPLGPEYFPTPVLSPRQACDDTRSCGSQPAYGSLSDCR